MRTCSRGDLFDRKLSSLFPFLLVQTDVSAPSFHLLFSALTLLDLPLGEGLVRGHLGTAVERAWEESLSDAVLEYPFGFGAVLGGGGCDQQNSNKRCYSHD